MTKARAALCAVVAVLALAGTACGGDDGSEAGGGASAAASSTDGGGGGGGGGGAGDQTVTIKDFTYDPSELTVDGSTTIEVLNEDDAEHSFTLDDDSVSQDVQPGESATVTIDPAASIGWHCEFHPDMTGTITVG
jgi:plastocyanin